MSTFTFLPAQDRPEGGWNGYKTLTGDVNGDGLTDLIWNETGNIN
ncbi:FG-GAP repeat protein, partial [Nostoc sp.]